MTELLQITEQNFETEVLKSDIPVLVDFWAEWCAPCRMIGPIVKELASEYDGKLRVAKLDVDSLGSIAQRYRILSIPTVIIFKNGEVASQIIGAVPKKDLVSQVEKAIA
ncbi:MAG: thioredoxin [candidate division Zixibacteria bacterium]|nr:thioredoxin [candidate division Zixibacteria bacterium]